MKIEHNGMEQKNASDFLICCAEFLENLTKKGFKLASVEISIREMLTKK